MNEIVVDECRIRVFDTGAVQRETVKGAWKTVTNSANHTKGYNVILIGKTKKKQYMRSRLVYMAFMMGDTTQKIVMHHKDGDRLNCQLSNLTVETYSSISYYRTDTCGWQYDPKTDTYHASITKEKETISLGRYKTSDEAYEAYIHARAKLQQDYQRSKLPTETC